MSFSTVITALLLAVLFIAAVRYLCRHPHLLGGCSGSCHSCPGSCPIRRSDRDSSRS